ncbi:MAG TPA: hypothetical protein VJP80_02490 [Candidatus Saccharimonadales bacterium]|nr:hypothetical protein [Candidatus Saccharimonadales bacterium]
MDDASSTKVKVSENSPTGVASRAHGANVDALAFNITFIASRNPNLAVKIMKLYDEARQISADDPPHPEEDFTLALSDLPDPFGKA